MRNTNARKTQIKSLPDAFFRKMGKIPDKTEFSRLNVVLPPATPAP
jgi:hypothetical protein